ncbi:MAG: UvrB/UvrC motif-containing protein [Alkalispirochaeta sp.]
MDDLTDLFRSWPYDPQQTMRIIVARDGRSVLQVRLPLGIEQYEMEGRPDGVRPDGFDTVLDRTQHRLKEHIFDTGGDAGFYVTPREAAELQAEGVLFYYRYLLLFQLRNFDSVLRDTEHNLHLCDILERYCENEEARNAVLQFRPYIIRINIAARALAIARGELPGDALEVIDEGITRIERLEEIDSPAFQFERIRSVNYLQGLRRKIETSDGDDPAGVGDPDVDSYEDVEPGTGTPREEGDATDLRSRLERELQNAVDAEDYERAAQIRDALKRRR